MKLGGRGILLAVVSIAVAVAIATGFLMLGTPQDARKQELDRRRVEDLTAIAQEIQSIYAEPEGDAPLPDSLKQVAVQVAPSEGRRDPVTNLPYAYRKLAPDRFELCATFDTQAESPDPRSGDPGWGHPAGRVCFEFRAQKTMSFPVRPAAIRSR